ncbi:MAG TPA: hypothetical protein VF908_02950, partial [Gemmatimonadaceae bacterium]
PISSAINRMFIIVSREQSAQYAYRKHLFEKEAIDVILDRRAGERRQLVATDRARPERRGRDRRQSDITTDLQKFGWAIVRRRET